MKKISLTILVPVYNEEATLNKLLTKLEKIASDEIQLIIVNDGSKDRSQEIIDAFVARKVFKHTKSITHPKNKGKGAGIQTGIANATGEYFVIQDADLEYDPIDIPPLIEYAKEHKVKAVYGSRFLGHIEGMPTPNFYANRTYNFILRRLYPTKITDMHTCYKMVQTELLREIKMSSNGFGYATELVSKLLKRGIEIHELPINFKGRTRQEGKKINAFDGFECIFDMLHYRYGHKTAFINTANFKMVLKFGVVGTIGFLTNYAILSLLSNTYSARVAEVIAIAISLQVTFLFNDRWTYSHLGKPIHKIQARYMYYMSTNILGGVVTGVGFVAANNYFSRLPSLVIGSILGLIWNFTFNKLVTWRVRAS